MGVKICTKCHIEKELTDTNFRIRKGKYISQCRECERAYTRRNQKERYAADKDKILSKNKKWRDKNKDYIKEYNHAYHKEYTEKNKELLLEKQREYRRDNESNVKANQQRYYQENKENYKENGRRWREENREKYNEIQRTWRQNNQEKVRIYRQRRRTLEESTIADLTEEDWEFTKDYFNNTCAYCGDVDSKLCQDHFIPLTSGGGYTISNIIPACTSCNSSKHNNSFFDWYPNHKSYNQEREEKILCFLEDVKMLGAK